MISDFMKHAVAHLATLLRPAWRDYEGQEKNKRC